MFGKARTFASIALAALRDRGPAFVARRAADYAASFVAARYYARVPPKETFTALGRDHAYFYHLYNITWKNERAVEVAVALDFVDRHAGARLLEVGNALSWYRAWPHDVLDKYEAARGVLNEDIVEFAPTQRYDAIVSVSTLEHVGWDETPRDPPKVLRAFARLHELLAPGGAMLVTVPLGYNPTLDAALREGALGFARSAFMLRTARTRWREAAWHEVAHVEYDRPFRGANALWIGLHTRASQSS